jgi:hypothetical protein
MMRRNTNIVAAVCLTLGGQLHAAEAVSVEEITDLLQGRWYEAEVIVFERLPTLDVTNAERLVALSDRSWPQGMVALAETERLRREDGDVVMGDVEAPSLSEAEINEKIWQNLEVSDERCIGFAPTIVRPLPAVEGRQAIDPPPVLDEIHPELVRVLFPNQVVPSPPIPLIPIEQQHIVPPPPPSDEPLLADEPQFTDAPADPKIELTPLLQLLADVAAYESELVRTSMTWLQDSEFVLTDAVKAINRQRHLRPVFHGRWRQQVPAREAPTIVHLASRVDPDAPQTRSGLAKVEGTLSLSVARYLHFAPRLWYHADTLGLEPVTLPLPGSDVASDLAPLANTRFMELHESRRMRSGELHYIDHPKLGVIVRIDPVTIPDELVAQWEALHGEEDSEAVESAE